MENISTAIYSVLDQKVEGRRKPIVVPICAAVVFIAVFAAGLTAEHPNVHFGVSLCGAMGLSISLMLIAARLFGGGHYPYYLPSSEFLVRKERFYTNEQLDKLQTLVARGDYDGVCALPTVDSSNVMLVSYQTGDGKVAVCQIQTYIPHEYRPVSEAVVMRKYSK